MVVHKVIDIQNELLSGEAGHVDFLGVHADGVHRAGFDAEAAEDAAEEIDVVDFRLLFDVRVRVFLGDDLDAFGGTSGRAQHARGATHRTVLLLHQAVLGPVVGGNGLRLFRVFVNRKLTAPHHVADQMAERDEKPFKGGNDVKPLQQRHGATIQRFDFQTTHAGRIRGNTHKKRHVMGVDLCQRERPQEARQP